MDNNSNQILLKNKKSWDAMADLWFGTTALPEYGCFVPNENDLNLFSDNLAEKKVIDVGCGSGHSLEWCYKRGAKEYPVTVQNYRMSTCINSLASARLMVEELIEDSKSEILERVYEFSSRYYKEYRASKMPLSFIIKARKI